MLTLILFIIALSGKTFAMEEPSSLAKTIHDKATHICITYEHVAKKSSDTHSLEEGTKLDNIAQPKISISGWTLLQKDPFTFLCENLNICKKLNGFSVSIDDSVHDSSKKDRTLPNLFQKKESPKKNNSLSRKENARYKSIQTTYKPI